VRRDRAPELRRLQEGGGLPTLLLLVPFEHDFEGQRVSVCRYCDS
jgi:hypothetical protein